MADVTADYQKFQIASSESMRAGAADGLDFQERIAHFEEAMHWSKKAFFEAKQNVYARVLAFSQYQCAVGLVLLAQNEYNSIVVSDEEPKNVIGRD